MNQRVVIQNKETDSSWFHNVHLQILEMADMLSDGIFDQLVVKIQNEPFIQIALTQKTYFPGNSFTFFDPDWKSKVDEFWN